MHGIDQVLLLIAEIVAIRHCVLWIAGEGGITEKVDWLFNFIALLPLLLCSCSEHYKKKGFFFFLVFSFFFLFFFQ